MKQSYKLINDQVRRNAANAVMQAPDEYTVEIKPENRTIMQNRLMWPLLNDLSKQVEWFMGDGLTQLSPEDWKDVLTASLHGEQRLSQGINGGLVLLGVRTSKMGKKEFSDLITLIYAFGTEKGVVWSDNVEIPEWAK